MHIPEDIFKKIMLYVSHPVADIMRLEVESCLEHYVPINNGYEYEYGGEESFVESYFKLQNWLKKEGEIMCNCPDDCRVHNYRLV
jgi:hypothetical protein